MTDLFLSPTGRVYSADGREFDPWDWSWKSADPGAPARADLRQVPAIEALREIGRGGKARKVPIGVIGPRDATEEQTQLATELGRELADLGLTVICGGKNGVMQAVAQGVHQAGGLCVGLLPEENWREANPYIALPIATGIGKARNVLIAQSSAALVAIGGQYGTLSEIAFGLHFDKPVFGLGDVPDLADIRKAASVDEVCQGIADFLLRHS